MSDDPEARNTRHTVTRPVRRIAGVLVLLASAAACAPPRLPTARGPEDPGLIGEITGTVLLKHRGSVAAFSLPAFARIPIERATSTPPPTGHTLAVAGPDEAGRIALLTGFSKPANLVSMTLPGAGSTTSIFERPGSEFGRSFALSRARGRVATLAACHGEQMGDPPAWLEVCDVEIWDIVGAQRLAATARAVDLGLSWFPDATKLAYVTLVERSAIPSSVRAASDPGHSYHASIAKWVRVPVVAVLDVESGVTDLLYEGENPLVSPDGSFVLLHDHDPGWKSVAYRRVNLATREVRPVTFPGATHEAVALMTPRVVLYRGLPTAGVAQGWRWTSMGGKVPFWTLKVAALDTGRFATLLPELDIHDRVSFGPGSFTSPR